MKNRILLDNYYPPGDLERQIGAFVEHYNHVRYHESINLTPRRLLWQSPGNPGRTSAHQPRHQCKSSLGIDCKPLNSNP
jgi:hypothetical protein